MITRCELGPKNWTTRQGDYWSKLPNLWRGRTKVKKRRLHTEASKFRVPLEALQGGKTIRQLLSEHGVHANLIGAWKRQLLEDGPNVFAVKDKRKQGAREAELYEQIERLIIELGWLKSKVEGSNQGETACGR